MQQNSKHELIAAIVGKIPHARELGIKVISATHGEATLKLPFDQRLVGNPATGILHGGAISTLIDTACGMAVLTVLEESELCPTLDLRVDHMRASVSGETLNCRAEVIRVTRRVLFVRGTAYHDESHRPVAICVATFARLKPGDYSGAVTWGEQSVL